MTRVFLIISRIFGIQLANFYKRFHWFGSVSLQIYHSQHDRCWLYDSMTLKNHSSISIERALTWQQQPQFM